VLKNFRLRGCFVKQHYALCLGFLCNLAISSNYFQSNLSINGSRCLFSKRYNEAVYATAHNGQSYKKSIVQNQDRTIEQQLQAGIRAIKIPIWYGCDSGGHYYACACHGVSKSLFFDLCQEQVLEQIPTLCRPIAKRFFKFVGPAIPTVRNALRLAYGSTDDQHGPIPFMHGMFDPASQPLKNICSTVYTFLNTHPHEVVTLILEDYTGNVALIAEAIKDSKLVTYAHRQDNDKPWPTLGSMVCANKRLVVFVRSSQKNFKSRYPWLHQLWDFAWDTRFSFKRIGDFRHDKIPHRGKDAFKLKDTGPRNKLFIVYHFVTPCTGGSIRWARRANKISVLSRRLERVARQAQHIPNFIQVDFFEYPNNDIFRVVDTLNSGKKN
jgi:hypothetical protein